MRAQVSFEFISLFTIVLFVFVLAAYAFSQTLDRGVSTKEMAQNMADEIKMRCITASMAQADFETVYYLPSRINEVPIDVIINADGDDLLRIIDRDTNLVIARSFLPRLEDSTVSGTGRAREIRVTKTEGKIYAEVIRS